MANVAVWFDIPATDTARAAKFYAAVLNVKPEPIPGIDAFVLPHTGNDVSGCIVKSGHVHPGASGVLIYLNAQGRLEDAVAQVAAHGGKVIQDKHAIGPYGFRAIVIDSEGNQIGLHSM